MLPNKTPITWMVKMFWVVGKKGTMDLLSTNIRGYDQYFGYAWESEHKSLLLKKPHMYRAWRNQSANHLEDSFLLTCMHTNREYCTLSTKGEI